MPERNAKRHQLELILAKLGAWTLPFLPRCGILLLAHGLAGLAFLVAVRDRKVARANLISVYGDSLSTAARNRIIYGSLHSFAMLVLDLFWFHRFSEKRIKRYVAFDDSTQSYFETEAAIVVAAHFGNWEVGAQAAAYRGRPLVSIAAEVGSASLNRLLVNLREKSGQTIATQKGAVRALLKVLKSGQRTALLLDQNTLPAEGGEFVDFMGLPAPVSMAGAMLSFRTGAPLIVSYCVAEGWGRYRCYSFEPLYVTSNNKDTATQDIANQMSTMIRRHPEQWLWMYKRWKYIPEGHSGDNFPYYARRLES